MRPHVLDERPDGELNWRRSLSLSNLPDRGLCAFLQAASRRIGCPSHSRAGRVRLVLEVVLGGSLGCRDVSCYRDGGCYRRRGQQFTGSLR